MEELLTNLLSNTKIDDETIFQILVSHLQVSPLSYEQYETLIEICQNHMEDIELSNRVNKINSIIEDLKTRSSNNPSFSDFINGLYKIKAYVNDENEITEKNPTIEHVIEFNYNKKNITLFNITIFDNQNDAVKTEVSIQIQDESESDNEMDEDEDEDQNEMKSDVEDENKEMEVNDKDIISFENETCLDGFMNFMGWTPSESKEILKFFLNSIFTVFENDTPLKW
jgi:hypothetical protein